MYNELNLSFNSSYNPYFQTITDACVTYPALEKALPILIFSFIIIFFLRYYLATIKDTELKQFDKHRHLIHAIMFHASTLLMLLIGCIIGFIIIS